MLLNSLNNAFKDAFYNLERIFTGVKSSDLESAERERLHAISQKEKGMEASIASGEFLARARRGEALHQDKETEEICKDFVRGKLFPVDETENLAQEETPVAEMLTRSITEEIPVFGLKASLHASTETGSFDTWKSVHFLSAEEAEIQEKSATEVDEATEQLRAVGRAWRDLSVHTALRLIDHPHTPGFVLMELAQHPSAEVRAQVVDNANTPKEAVLRLLSDESIDVRLSLAECYHLGISVLEMLVDDENPYVCDRAESTLQRLKASTSASVIRGLFGMTGVSYDEEENVTPIRARA